MNDSLLDQTSRREKCRISMRFLVWILVFLMLNTIVYLVAQTDIRHVTVFRPPAIAYYIGQNMDEKSVRLGNKSLKTINGATNCNIMRFGNLSMEARNCFMNVPEKLYDNTAIEINRTRRKGVSVDFNHSHVKFITLKEFTGRTGNNLFQLIVLLATAKKHCMIPRIHAFPYEKYKQLADIFNLEGIQVVYTLDKGARTCMFNEREGFGPTYHTDIEYLNPNFNWVLKGFFQSWRYFFDVAEFIKTKIKFKEDVTNSAKAFLANNVFKNTTKVCVHVRRGDMTWADHKKVGFGVADIRYINNSIAYYTERIRSSGRAIIFIIVSDDIPWCVRTFKLLNISNTQVKYSEFSRNNDRLSVGKDLALMSQCDHSIITSGTFGWLGAWLNGGHVVYYKGFPSPGSEKDKRMNRTEYYPPNWVGML